MKLPFYLFVLLFILSSCSEKVTTTNPNVPNYSFSVDINMSLPSYSNLLHPSNAIFYGDYGVKGLIIFNTGSGYNAFDAACPNQAQSSCSTMKIDGVNAVCPCDSKSYSLFSGQGSLQYPMKQYSVELNGNVLRVSN